jgi:hypothetical protein
MVLDICMVDKVPLSVSFYELYVVSSDPGALVGEMVDNGVWIVNFIRELDAGQLYFGIHCLRSYKG